MISHGCNTLKNISRVDQVKGEREVELVAHTGSCEAVDMICVSGKGPMEAFVSTLMNRGVKAKGSFMN